MMERDAKGRLLPGHKGTNKPLLPPTIDPLDTDTDFDAAILNAATTFGRPGGKAKTGLAGYCNNLMHHRPQDFAALVTRALSRRSLASQSSASAIPITVDIVPCPANHFVSAEAASAVWSAKITGRPQLIDEPPDDPPDDTLTDPDNAA
jgi:hypothetical protein